MSLEKVLSEITTPGSAPSPGPPIWHKFLASTEAEPESLALVAMHQRADLYGFPSLLDEEEVALGQVSPAYLRWSYATLKNAIVRLVTGLQSIGVDSGTPIVSFLPLGAEGALALWASEALDCIWIPLNTRSLANSAEVTHMVRTGLSVAAPAKRPVILVEDDDVARKVDDLNLDGLAGAYKVVVNDQAASPGWAAFAELMTERQHELSEEVLQRGGHDSSFVVFTSGTTSLPKGVHATPLAHFERYLEAMWLSPQFASLPPPRALCAGPANHVPGRYQQVWPLCMRGTAVYASPAFDLERTAEALVKEKITHVALVPTMVIALANELKRPLKHLREVRVGSAGVLPEVARMCIDKLGADRVQVGYGMTEGLYIFSGLRPLEELIDDEDIAVGWPQPEATVKICDPETGKTVPRGVSGVVHYAGPTVAREYIGGNLAGVCYQDAEGRHWLNTGDVGRIDDRDRLFLTGRHKDMIIRGGENISPAAIEAALNTDPSIAALRPQVVGAPDPIAGQVPVVIILGNVDGKVKKGILGLVLAKMGPSYLPDDVVSVEDLGLREYPLTTSGKIQRKELEGLVRRRRQTIAGASQTHDVATVVREVWAKSIGLDSSELNEDAPIASFGDSITLMRVRAEIRRAMGTAPSMVDILNAESIAALVKLVEAQKPVAGAVDTTSKREGPPQAEDMVHLSLDTDGSELGRTMAVVSATVEKHGFSWGDVEDVTPAYDFSSIQRHEEEYETWKFMYGYLIKGSDKVTLRRALESTLSHHRILASFLVDDASLLGGRDVLHVLMRRSQRYLDLIIQDNGETATTDTFHTLLLQTQCASSTGPMAQFRLYTIASTGETALLAAINHTVMDGFSVDLFLEDLDQALNNPRARPRRVDYKAWADNHYSLRSSLPAQTSVAFHAARLVNVADHHAAALYPPISRARARDARARDRAHKPLQANYHTEWIPLGPFEAIRQRHGIQPSVVVKAAMALFNARKTGHTHALFSSLESNRNRFSSFLPTSVAVAQEGADVAGPTYVPVIDLVSVPRNEPVSSFVRRLADDGALLTRHAAAPWYALRDAIAPEAKPLLPEIVAAQVFNWLGPIGGGGAFEKIELVDAMVRPKIGVRVMAGENRERGEIFLWVDGDGFGTLSEFKSITEAAAQIVRWLVEEGNWEKQVGEII
ncbi:acetyl-CoA synthetase-like protein [Xylariomycetidae sp. FL2044]|nr:acetyl-CoA synthetase-like protein [Xylariomycetidae sp. FL2044]